MIEAIYTKKDRWWDNSTGIQKEHIVCWFARKYFDNGSTKKCIKSNYHIRCKECHFAEIENSPDCNPQAKNAPDVSNHMGRPEMYFCIAETLKAISEKDLKDCICKIENAMDNNLSWKDIIKECTTWKLVVTSIQLNHRR